MSPRFLLSERLRVAHLSPTRPNPFDIAPDAEARARIAQDLDLTELPELRFSGSVRASGADDWALTGRLAARVIQPCAITLEPVETTLAEDVALIFSPHVAAPEAEEIEMGDDSVESLGQWINIGEIALETLALALPMHPLAPGAEMPAGLEPDDTADDEGTRRPFAGLADLMKDRR